MSWGDFTVPKGYRFQPTDEELLSELEQKIHCKDSQITTIIPEIDMYKYEPRQLPELAFKGAENLGRKFFFLFFFWFVKKETWDSQREWYFFAPRDYKSINSNRSNRTTGEGYWNTTGRGSAIKAPGSKAVIGRKRTLTFHKSGVPKPQGRTGWVMHEYYLIQEHCDDPKQIGEFVVCCLKYKSDDSDHDKEAPFYNQEFKGTEQNDHSTSVEDRPDRTNSSYMVDEPLNDPENLDSLFNPPAPPRLHQLHQSPMNTTNIVHKKECRKRPYPFEHDHPTLPKKNNVSTNDDDRQVSNSTPNFENQAANVIPEGHSHPGERLGSDSDSFLPSINGGPGEFSNYNDFIELDDFIKKIELDDLLSVCEGNYSSLAEFSDTIIDEGRRVTSDGNTLVGHGSENDFSALAFGASLHRS